MAVEILMQKSVVKWQCKMLESLVAKNLTEESGLGWQLY
jgi:hypothetical protein